MGELSAVNFNFGSLVPVFWGIIAVTGYSAHTDDTWYAIWDIPNSFLSNLRVPKDYD